MGKGKLKFGVLAVSAMGMGAMVTNPVLADIMKAFPDIDPTTVMLISGLPSLFVVFFAPIYGKLTQYFPKKALLAFASLCFVLGGFLPAFMSNFTLILAMRCLLGVGLGFLMPMAADLISDFFDGHERQTMMGFQSAFTSIGGIMYQMAGGFLGSFGWNYAFYAYLLGVLIFLAVHLTLPEPQRKVAPKGEKLNGFAIGYTSYNLYQFFVATTIIGLAMGVLVPSYWVKISVTVPPPLVALGISIGVSGMNIGGFVQPYVYDGISKIFGLQIGRESFLVAVFASLLMAVFVLVEALVAKSKKKDLENNKVL